MIQTNPAPRNVPEWQRELSHALRSPAELLAALGLPAGLAAATVADFPLRVPRPFVARMRRGDPHDPLFLQVWPRPQEQTTAPDERDDAVGDLGRLRAGGLIHKYRGRALVVATGACAVHCRYCFRRHFPYADHFAGNDRWQATLREIAADRSIEEVILSGGDPLSLPDDKLAPLAEALEFIPHVRRLRIHTRQPVVLPQRVDEALLAWLRRGRLQKVIVVHVNHAQELDGPLRAALALLRGTGATLLNQSVLLRGVNDDAGVLADLSESLFAAGVLPYYLHMTDRVRGTAHFRVPEPEALGLVREVSARLPGYLVPRLVREDAGAPSKTPLL
ncbi:MAG TPA: EF-P beta-lysylation protein EpmB [Candidatus Binatia bacterium]|nr:EF-P beta-lysylation protein EpmB [Candidatus Binatia bacterium]